MPIFEILQNLEEAILRFLGFCSSKEFLAGRASSSSLLKRKNYFQVSIKSDQMHAKERRVFVWYFCV
jgi:hypothetical protein